MLKRCLLYFSFSVLLFSCKPDYREKILGEWKIVGLSFDGKDFHEKDSLRRSWWGKYSSYEFFEGNRCEERSGNLVSRGLYNFNAIYKINGDSLKVYSQDQKKWTAMKIKSIKGDTMILDFGYEEYIKGNIYHKYVRQHYKTDTTLKFDQIGISYGAWSTERELLIDKTGNVVYCNNYLKPEYFLTGNISLAKFNKIEDSFARCKFTKLDSDYFDGSSDSQFVLITLIKDGKIIKTVGDSDCSGPAELIWAYTPLLDLKNKLKMDTIKNKAISVCFFHAFKSDTKVHYLQSTESFYLWNLLRLAIERKIFFNKKYDVNLYNTTGPIIKVATDGKLYQFVLKDGTKHLYDLGFDFISVNSANFKFEAKHDYD